MLYRLLAGLIDPSIVLTVTSPHPRAQQPDAEQSGRDQVNCSLGGGDGEGLAARRGHGLRHSIIFHTLYLYSRTFRVEENDERVGRVNTSLKTRAQPEHSPTIANVKDERLLSSRCIERAGRSPLRMRGPWMASYSVFERML